MTGSAKVTGLAQLVATLAGAPAAVLVEEIAITKKAGMVLRRDMQASADAATPRGYAKRMPGAITYDTFVTPLGVEVEVGPDKSLPKKQGALGNLMAFGSRNNAPVWDFAAGLLPESIVYEREIDRAVARVLK